MGGFTFSGAPVISSFSPHSGAVGTTVVINGKNFNKTVVNNIVYFGAVRAPVTSASTYSLTVIAPAGATYKPISVLDSATGLIGYSGEPFNLSFPPGTDSFTAASFAEKVEFGTNYTNVNISSMDLDGDKLADIILKKYYGYISILRNKSTTGAVLFDEPN